MWTLLLHHNSLLGYIQRPNLTMLCLFLEIRPLTILWKGDIERLCAMKHKAVMSWIRLQWDSNLGPCDLKLGGITDWPSRCFQIWLERKGKNKMPGYYIQKFIHWYTLARKGTSIAPDNALFPTKKYSFFFSFFFSFLFSIKTCCGYSLEAPFRSTFNEYLQQILIALVKAFLSIQKYWYFSYFSMKTYVVGTH